MNLKTFFNKHWIQLLLSLFGAIGGFFYWQRVGCLSGGCPLQSTWYLSSLWGAVLGYLVGDLIAGQKKKK